MSFSESHRQWGDTGQVDREERIKAVGAIVRFALEEHYGCEVRFVTTPKSGEVPDAVSIQYQSQEEHADS